MKLRSKVLAGFMISVLALSLMIGNALAVQELPATYDKAANGTVAEKTSDQDVWIKIIGSGKIYGNADIAHATKSVDVTFSGNVTCDVSFTYNRDSGWGPSDKQAGVVVNGDTVLNFPMDGADTTWCEAIINVANKTEGDLAVTKMEFKDADSKVLLTVPEATEAAAETAPETTADAAAETAATDTAATDTAVAPKTGVASAALILGLGTVLFGTGAVVLKKKER